MTNPNRYRVAVECSWCLREDGTRPDWCVVCHGGGYYLAALDRLPPHVLRELDEEVTRLLAAYARIERCRQCDRPLEEYFRGPRLCDSCADALAERLDPIAVAQEEVA